MDRIKEAATVARDAENLWREIGGFGAVGDWHPMLAKVRAEGEQPGSIRTAETKDGKKQIEQLLAAAPNQRFYSYRMISTPLPVSDYVGEFRVADGPNGTSTINWSCEFTVTSADGAAVPETIRTFLRAGLDNLRNMYGAA